MLRPKPLAEVLRQAATGGVQRVTLLKVDGSLLAYAGEANKDPEVHAALASNVWGSYTGERDDDNSLGNLEHVLLHCEGGKLVVTKVATVLLALMSDESVGFGMLKAKAEAIVSYLGEPLSKVDMMDNE